MAMDEAEQWPKACSASSKWPKAKQRRNERDTADGTWTEFGEQRAADNDDDMFADMSVMPTQ